MFTVAIILLGLIPLVIFVLLVRASRSTPWIDPDEHPPEDPPDVAG
jgi:hypothetical protein